MFDTLDLKHLESFMIDRQWLQVVDVFGGRESVLP